MARSKHGIVRWLSCSDRHGPVWRAMLGLPVRHGRRPDSARIILQSHRPAKYLTRSSFSLSLIFFVDSPSCSLARPSPPLRALASTLPFLLRFSGGSPVGGCVNNRRGGVARRGWRVRGQQAWAAASIENGRRMTQA